MINPIIRTENLQRVFKTDAGDLDVLKGINISFMKGEALAIVGASGVGKSTFLHILGTIDKPSSGSVFFYNDDLFQMKESALISFRNRSLGFIFQFHHLLPEFNTLENVIMPGLIAGYDKDQLKERAMNLLAKIGLEKRAMHRTGEISGGEQQRVAVARALILEPQVVLADEPTGNLDTKTGETLFNLMLMLNEEKETTLVTVTHNEALAKKCDKVYEMTDGVLN